MAAAFVETWKQHPPQSPHGFYVVANAAECPPIRKARFTGLNAQWFTHNNQGWDIGAYQVMADLIACDMMVCLGAHIRFNHDGWLERMVDAYVQHGPGLYGPWGAMYPNPHIRTTAFWCPPQLLQSYPDKVGSARPSRYMFEHGVRSFTKHTLMAGLPCIMVTMKGCFPYPDWERNNPSSAESIILDKQHR